MAVKEKVQEKDIKVEVKETNKTDTKKSLQQDKEKNKLFLIPIVIIVILILVILGISNRNGSVEIKVKSSLDKIVEKSDLETVNFTYNVIAKQCKDEKKCDMNSNDIDDFEYVVSCKGTITAGIDFKEIDVSVDEKNKKILIKIPDAFSTDVTLKSKTFLNGKELPANKIVEAEKLCKKTIKEKSDADNKLLSVAKEQAEIVLQSFYEQWVKSFDEEYIVEVK